MSDITIIVSRRGKAQVSAMTNRGWNWIKSNMTDESPVLIDSDAVDEIRNLIESDGLSVDEK